MLAPTTVRASLKSGSAIVLSAGLLAGCGLLPQPAPAPGAPAHGVTVMTGLNSPQGVLVAPDGTVWASDSGTGGENKFTLPADPTTTPPTPAMTGSYGDTARVLKVTPGGAQSVVANTTSVAGGEEPTGGAKLALLNGNVYLANGTWDEGLAELVPNHPAELSAVLRLEDGAPSVVADLWNFEKTNNPDKNQPYEPELDSHAYGLTAGPDGQLYVADAAGNDVLRLDPATGKLSLVAVFGPVTQPVGPNGAAVPFQPVPTSVAFGADGSMYVSLLPGGPALPGTTKVVKVAEDGAVSDFATGLTTLTDLKTGPDGNLYATSVGPYGGEDEGPVANGGAIIRVKPDAAGKPASETVLGGLNQPTAIAFNARGDAFVALGGASAPGKGKVVRYDFLTTYQAQ